MKHQEQEEYRKHLEQAFNITVTMDIANDLDLEELGHMYIYKFTIGGYNYQIIRYEKPAKCSCSIKFSNNINFINADGPKSSIMYYNVDKLEDCENILKAHIEFVKYDIFKIYG